MCIESGSFSVYAVKLPCMLAHVPNVEDEAFGVGLDLCVF